VHASVLLLTMNKTVWAFVLCSGGDVPSKPQLTPSDRSGEIEVHKKRQEEAMFVQQQFSTSKKVSSKEWSVDFVLVSMQLFT
jgi:hypothetical protein